MLEYDRRRPGYIACNTHQRHLVWDRVAAATPNRSRGLDRGRGGTKAALAATEESPGIGNQGRARRVDGASTPYIAPARRSRPAGETGREDLRVPHVPETDAHNQTMSIEIIELAASLSTHLGKSGCWIGPAGQAVPGSSAGRRVTIVRRSGNVSLVNSALDASLRTISSLRRSRNSSTGPRP